MYQFLLATIFLLITPGPGVLSTAGVGAAYGFRAGFGYVLGLWLGNNLVGLIVVSGLAAVVFSVPSVRIVLTVLSMAYLLYIAVRIAFAGAKVGFITPETVPSTRDGLLLQFINPKAYVVNSAMFSGFVIYPDYFALEIIVKFLIANAVWIPVHFAWLGAGVYLHRLDLPTKTQRIINMGMAASMIAVVVIAVFSN